MMDDMSKLKKQLYDYYQTYDYLTSGELVSDNFIRRVCARRLLISVEAAVGENGKNKKVLDAGCGDGTYSIMFARRGFDVVGVDLSKNLVNFSRKRSESDRLKIDFSQVDIDALPFKDNTFGTIICIETLEHMPDPIASLSEFRRVLKPLGRIVITVPNKLNPYFRLQDYIYKLFNKKLEPVHRSYTKSELRNLVVKAGFSVEKCMYEGYFVNILLTAAR